MNTRSLFQASLMMCFICFLPLHLSAAAQTFEQEAELSIGQLYNKLKQNSIVSMPERLEYISAHFLEKPYVLGALGEGDTGRYDQDPLYRTDAFDCLTFVETVIAAALANNVSQFQQCMQTIRYDNGDIDFTKRNHFTSLDWNPNNQKQGLLKDITSSIKNTKNQPVIKTAEALIDKPNWYQHLTTADIRLKNATPSLESERLAELQQKGLAFPRLKASIPYIPLNILFDAAGKANTGLFKQIPNAAIIEIVRPNWDLRDKTGTCLNVSHIGFAFWKGNQLLFREASSISNQTIDVDLIDYLRKSRQSPTIDGINIQEIVPEQPWPSGCSAFRTTSV